MSAISIVCNDLTSGARNASVRLASGKIIEIPYDEIMELIEEQRTCRRITWPKSEHFPRSHSDPGRTHLRPAEAPSAQIGRRQDLEMVTPEVLAKSASRNVVALKNARMGWVTRWTPTASSDEEPGRLMVVNFFPAATTRRRRCLST